MIEEIAIGAAVFERLSIAPLRKIAAFQADLLYRQRSILPVDDRCFARQADRGKGHDIDIVAFLKSDAFSVGGWNSSSA